MILSLRNLPQIVADGAVAAQSACAYVLDFSVGSIERALTEAAGAMVLWLQVVALQVLSATRLATSSGLDVDSFVNDYGMTRLPAVAATVPLAFARANPTGFGTVPAGAQVKTTDGSVTFQVLSDPTNAAWNGTGYTIAPGVTGVAVTGQALVTGPAGNVASGTISLLAGSFSGVDTVTNYAGGTGGVVAETDAALRTRFQLYIASLSSATVAALEYAATSVQQGLTATVQENTPILGTSTVTLDDGSGHPSSALLNAASIAVNAVRAAGTTALVHAPAITGVSVNVILTLAPTAVRPPYDATVSQAVSAYVASLPVGATCSYAYLGYVVFNALPGILNADITLNGGTTDVVPAVNGVVRASAVTVE